MTESKAKKIYRKYADYTMIPEEIFMENLILCAEYKDIPGSVIECGVWRGGMTAAIAELLGTARKYYLFDSFEGLPEAKEIDGQAALRWQANTDSPDYFNNCKAEVSEAHEAMKKSGSDYKIIPGWFEDTLQDFAPAEPAAILRLDADWYDSTLLCLQKLYNKVTAGGLIIIDDYFVWDGCSRAVHDFLSKSGLPDRIRTSPGGVCYIEKGK